LYLEQEAIDAVRSLRFPLDAALLEGGSLSSRVIGNNMEFENYSAYFPGADLRSLDWEVLARSRRKVVKRYGSDLRSSVEVYLDASHSMDYDNKALITLRLTAFLLYFLSLHHEVRFFWINNQLHEEGIVRPMNIENLLHRVHFEGSFEFPPLKARPQVTRFLISDLWENKGWIKNVLSHRFRIFQVLTPHEMDLGFSGYVSLTDLENGRKIDLSASEYGRLYRTEFQHRQTELQNRFSASGLWYGLIRTDQTYYTEVVRLLTQGGGT